MNVDWTPGYFVLATTRSKVACPCGWYARSATPEGRAVWLDHHIATVHAGRVQ